MESSTIAARKLRNLVMKINLIGSALAMWAAMSCSGQAQTVPVTADNFPRAESDLYMGNMVKE